MERFSMLSSLPIQYAPPGEGVAWSHGKAHHEDTGGDDDALNFLLLRRGDRHRIGAHALREGLGDVLTIRGRGDLAGLFAI